MIAYPDIEAVALVIGPLKIHWYGLMYLVAIVSAWLLALYRARNSELGWSRKMVEDLIFIGALGVILGGRLGYTLFYNFPAFVDDPTTLFHIWKGGMSFHGGMLGVFLGLYIFGRRNGMTFFQVSDFVAPLIPLGLGAGRIGNFINKELIGRPAETTMPWLMDYGDQIARHPSSLYQAMTEGLLLFLILWIYSAKYRPLMAVSAVFMFSYGCFRFMTEFFRTPDAHLGFIAFDWLSMGQLLSLPMIIFGIVVYWLAMKQQNNGRRLAE